MDAKLIKLIATTLNLSERGVKNCVELLDGGATVPFISRYRKEATGSLDEVQITSIKDEMERLSELQKRKQTVISTIEEQGKLTDELRSRIEQCWHANELEDIYLPYKPKHKTRAEVARQRGLEPLANVIMLQRERDVESAALKFVKGDVGSADDALAGARDIIAETISENETSRNRLRGAFRREAVITSKVVKKKLDEKTDDSEIEKFRDYFDWSEPLRRCSSHRLLAMRRGEALGYLRIAISPDDEAAVSKLTSQYVRSQGECARQVELAAADAYKRLLKPSIENEFAAESKAKADEEAINVFVQNLRQLLLAAPLGQKRVLALDPGFRTGCKLVCLDEHGTLLYHTAIYPHAPKNDYTGAARTVTKLVADYRIEAISIGNGTASRETEQFVRSLLFASPVDVFVVSENGASVYSASKVARDEFPDEDVTVRGAVSIGRRLMDPLAQLVKIDPKSIGVGQYQHDVDQRQLKKRLDQTVESCVNLVGVDLHTASMHLLTYVSGLGPVLAQNIVDYRAENGAFTSRSQLLKVPRLGRKAYEQCAGFLRIRGAKNPLDNTAVHPESYGIVEQMARDASCSVAELIADKTRRSKIDLQRYCTKEVGMPTLNDIMAELDKPGRDPRGEVERFSFDDSVHELSDLHVGMVLPGIVTNITQFGCFVDVGVHQDGLVHISQLCNRFVKDPSEVVSLHQHVRVKVTEVDVARKRISLSMKEV
ncbi:MAG: RNA-binding transcriptional accessory protein [Bacteroidaceae bacterium]|nr:RNA-binding transcriptional accessory protein [Bacteroidaceae bacterium]